MVFHGRNEPMKQRFKRKHPWLWSKNEFHFDDDVDDFCRTNRQLRRLHAKRNNGQKPKWRMKRKVQRLFSGRVKRAKTQRKRKNGQTD